MTTEINEKSGIAAVCRRIAKSNFFEYFILGVILVAAALVGIETYYIEPTGVAPHVSQVGDAQFWLDIMNQVVLWVFVLEASIKIGQYGTRPWLYFKDPWNVFDFSIVVICFLPLNASFATVLRLARIMRALRLLTAVPQLQLIVSALLRSIPSMGYVGVLLLLNHYVFAVIGVFLFQENDPVHYCDLPRSMLTLFRVLTLEDWTDVMYINMYGSDSYPDYEGLSTIDTGITRVSTASPLVAAAYFITFVVFATMIMLNLFIGVIINSMDEARAERDNEDRLTKRGAGKKHGPEEDIDVINGQLDDLKESLSKLKIRIKSGST